ncbi:MAG: AAA family ATPase, partial [Rhabdochlamydiaceae bacterium]
MITKVTTKHFKSFDDQSFDLSEHLVLAGPNNSGKTTLLQAIVVWYLAFQRWQERRGAKGSSAAKERIAVPITRKDFTAIPLREMGLMWTNTQTALKKEELSEGQKQGHPKAMSITLEGTSSSGDWKVTFEFRYSSSEQVYVKPSPDTIADVPKVDGAFEVVHVPPFSGIGVEETRYDQKYQNLLIGQGKPGDILRNLLREIFEERNGDWGEVQEIVQDIFGWRLLPPEYPGAFITCQYLPGIPNGKGDGGYPRLDISSAGSGFLQVLLIVAFIYARPATMLMLDEPDAHLHVVLQKQIYDR